MPVIAGKTAIANDIAVAWRYEIFFGYICQNNTMQDRTITVSKNAKYSSPTGWGNILKTYWRKGLASTAILLAAVYDVVIWAIESPTAAIYRMTSHSLSKHTIAQRGGSISYHILSGKTPTIYKAKNSPSIA